MTEFLKGYAAGANDMEAGRLVTKPFTDEDVERVAEALDPGAFTGPHVESQDWKNRRYDARTKGRRALSAYLEPTTKGDT